MKIKICVCVLTLMAACLSSANSIAKTATDCKDGEYYNTDIDDCTGCPKGKYCEKGLDKPCPKGTFADSDEVARTACTLCNPGYTTENEKSESNDDCKFCAEEKKDGACNCGGGKYPSGAGCTFCKKSCGVTYFDFPIGDYDVCDSNKSADKQCQRECKPGDVENAAEIVPGETISKDGTTTKTCKANKCESGFKLENGKCSSCGTLVAGEYCGAECPKGYYCPGDSGSCKSGNNDPAGYSGLCKCPVGATTDNPGKESITDCIIKGGSSVPGESNGCVDANRKDNGKCTRFCDSRGCFYLPKDVQILIFDL
jgi:hypothetical protein